MCYNKKNRLREQNKIRRYISNLETILYNLFISVLKKEEEKLNLCNKFKLVGCTLMLDFNSIGTSIKGATYSYDNTIYKVFLLFVIIYSNNIFNKSFYTQYGCFLWSRYNYLCSLISRNTAYN